MTLTINGDTRQTEAVTVLEFLMSINLPSQMVVVEHNGEIADVLEIVQMMAGG